MATLSRPTQNAFGKIGPRGLESILSKTGQLPKMELFIYSLTQKTTFKIDRFTNYNFSSSVLTPANAFSFGFAAPDGPPLHSIIKEGDTVIMKANNYQFFTGTIDQTEVETDSNMGERAQINGRDFVGRLEDQDAVSIDSKYVPAENATIDSAMLTILKDTPFEPLNKLKKQDAPRGTSSFSIDVGESKLACIQRYLDSLNCICWQDRLGRLVVGRPNMAQQPKGTFILNRDKRKSNVISIKVTRSSTQIPNIYVPVWSGQEQFQSINPTLVRLENKAYGPNRLRKYGYRNTKAVVSSMPSAGIGQQFTDINLLTTASAGSSSLIESMAKREMARANVKEITVQVVVPGHFNELGEPYQVDTMYYIDYDRGSLRRVLYCYSVDFSMDENGGQLTTLTFCRPGCIVSDIKAP